MLKLAHLPIAAIGPGDVYDPFGESLSGGSMAFGLVVIILGIVSVAYLLTLRRERRLGGWRGDATARIRSSLGALAEAERIALSGDYEGVLELVREAERELEEIREYPRRYRSEFAPEMEESGETDDDD